ncbi:MAG: alkane 1-monooxygenase [Ferruginibacter sp.]
MGIRVFKYLSPLSFYVLAFLSFSLHGWFTWLPLFYAWVLIPASELILGTNDKNMDAAEKEMARHHHAYDYMLYLIVLCQYLALIYFLFSMKETDLNGWEIAGRILSMGLLCGTFGINVAHELGHRATKSEQLMAKALLATSLYIHFFIEHNKGHHKHVATPDDPSSARYNEAVYSFYFRTIIFSYFSAWKIANADCRKKGKAVFSIYNEMLQAQLVQIALLISIYYFFGLMILLYFFAAAGIGILLLETVNYIEHYGLQRKQTTNGGYERTMPWHSWNSNHVLGRIMLFELSRHSDHHYLASKKYQLLDHHQNAPQLPTGYPGSMILSLLPPLWFYVMNKRIKEMEHSSK